MDAAGGDRGEAERNPRDKQVIGWYATGDDMKRLHELDQSDALAFGIASTWKRILLFFIACWFGVLVAEFCNKVPTIPGGLKHSGLVGMMMAALEMVVYVPFGWLGVFTDGLNGLGILMLPLLAAAFIIVLYSEKGFWHGIFLVLFAQPVEAMSGMNGVEPISWMFFALYLLGVFWAYGRCVLWSRPDWLR